MLTRLAKRDTKDAQAETSTALVVRKKTGYYDSDEFPDDEYDSYMITAEYDSDVAPALCEDTDSNDDTDVENILYTTEFGNLELVLDNGSGIDIFKSTDLCENIHISPRTVSLGGVDSSAPRLLVTREGEYDGFDVFYSPNVACNILSFSKRKEQGVQISYLENSNMFILLSHKSRTLHIFRLQRSVNRRGKFYVCDQRDRTTYDSNHRARAAYRSLQLADETAVALVTAHTMSLPQRMIANETAALSRYTTITELAKLENDGHIVRAAVPSVRHTVGSDSGEPWWSNTHPVNFGATNATFDLNPSNNISQTGQLGIMNTVRFGTSFSPRDYTAAMLARAVPIIQPQAESTDTTMWQENRIGTNFESSAWMSGHHSSDDSTFERAARAYRASVVTAGIIPSSREREEAQQALLSARYRPVPRRVDTAIDPSVFDDLHALIANSDSDNSEPDDDEKNRRSRRQATIDRAYQESLDTERARAQAAAIHTANLLTNEQTLDSEQRTDVEEERTLVTTVAENMRFFTKAQVEKLVWVSLSVLPCKGL